MIFVTLGSQRFQFNRLLIAIDEMIEKKIITQDIIAQTGASDYRPKYYKFKDFMTQNEFQQNMKNCDFVITHAGTGAIISALKLKKKVIAVPRLKRFGEHVDDHQIQLVDEFKNLNLIEPVYDIKDLEKALDVINNKKYENYVSNTDKIIDDLKEYIG